MYSKHEVQQQIPEKEEKVQFNSLHRVYEHIRAYRMAPIIG